VAKRIPCNPFEMESQVKNLLNRLMQEEAGQDVIEYGLLAAGISVVAITSITAVGSWVVTKWAAIDTALV